MALGERPGAGRDDAGDARRDAPGGAGGRRSGVGVLWSAAECCGSAAGWRSTGRCSPVRCLIKLNESNRRHYRSVVTAQTMCLLGMYCLRSSGLGALKMACGEDEEPQSHSQ